MKTRRKRICRGGIVGLFLPLVLWGRGVFDPFVEMAEELSAKAQAREREKGDVLSLSVLLT